MSMNEFSENIPNNDNVEKFDEIRERESEFN